VHLRSTSDEYSTVQYRVVRVRLQTSSTVLYRTVGKVATGQYSIPGSIRGYSTGSSTVLYSIRLSESFEGMKST
jgi:hypothetical protein